MKYKIAVFMINILFVLNLTAQEYKIITAKKGDTLWNLAKSYLKQPYKWKEIQNLNNIEDPKKIQVGQKIKIPVELAKTENESLLLTDKKESSIPVVTEEQAKLDDTIKQFSDKMITSPKEPEQVTAQNLIKKLEKDFEKNLDRKDIIKKQNKYFEAMNALEEAKSAFRLKDYKIALELANKSQMLYNEIKSQPYESTLAQSPPKIIYIRGNNEYYSNKEKNWVSIFSINIPVYQKDKYRTGPKSSSIISFKDGTIVKMAPETKIELVESTFDKKTNTLNAVMRLEKGNLSFIFRENAPLKIKFKLLVEHAEILGQGHFDVSLANDKVVKIQSYYGDLMVEANDKKQEVKSGYGVYIFPALAPSSPEKLLYPVTLDKPENNVYAKVARPTLSFQQEKKADRYRVQVSEDESFNAIVFDDITRTNRMQTSALIDGDYYWRVAPIDEKGFQGFFSDYRYFIVDTIAPRLVIFEPVSNQVVNDKYVKISGVTEPGHYVKINQHTIVPGKKGDFSVSYPFEQGTNVITFSVSDAAGNYSRTHKIIHVDYNNQLKEINGIAYSLFPKWQVHTYNAFGQIILNNSFYEPKFGIWDKELDFTKGENSLILSLQEVGYKEIKFIYDNDKPVLKTLRMIPIIQDKDLLLNVALKAVDVSSPLAEIAEVTIKEANNRSHKYPMILHYNSKLEEYQGVLKTHPKLLKKELVLSYVSVKDIVGNNMVIDEKDIESYPTPTDFWDKVKTNYKQLGLPAFILSAGGIILSL